MRTPSDTPARIEPEPVALGRREAVPSPDSGEAQAEGSLGGFLASGIRSLPPDARRKSHEPPQHRRRASQSMAASGSAMAAEHSDHDAAEPVATPASREESDGSNTEPAGPPLPSAPPNTPAPASSEQLSSSKRHLNGYGISIPRSPRTPAFDDLFLKPALLASQQFSPAEVELGRRPTHPVELESFSPRPHQRLAPSYGAAPHDGAALGGPSTPPSSDARPSLEPHAQWQVAGAGRGRSRSPFELAYHAPGAPGHRVAGVAELGQALESGSASEQVAASDHESHDRQGALPQRLFTSALQWAAVDGAAHAQDDAMRGAATDPGNASAHSRVASSKG